MKLFIRIYMEYQAEKVPLTSSQNIRFLNAGFYSIFNKPKRACSAMNGKQCFETIQSRTIENKAGKARQE